MPWLNPLAESGAAYAQSTRAATSQRRWMKWIMGASIGMVVLIAVGIYFAGTYWPYRHRVVDPQLDDIFGSQVKFSRYRRTYFPSPGFVAWGITLRRKSAPDLPPLGSVEKVVITGRWADLFLLRKRVAFVEITGLHLVVPRIGSRANHEDFPPGSLTDFEGPDILIEHCIFRDAILDILGAGDHRTSFHIHQLQIQNLQKGQVLTYAVDMENAIPSGRIQAWGTFGPLNAKDLGATRVKGDFSFSSIALHDIGELRGTMSSSGHFSGSLAAIDAQATFDTPDYAVSDGERTPVSGHLQCIVNGLNGNVTIDHLEARSGATIVRASGSVKGTPKVAHIDFEVANGRAQDVLRPFVQSSVPIIGPVSLHGHAYVAPATRGVEFLHRLRAEGAFDVPAELVTDAEREASLSAFSERARTHKTDNTEHGSVGKGSSKHVDVLSSLEGPVTIRDGIAYSNGVTFAVQGAEANLSGTFNFHNENVHLVGNLRMQSDVSHVTTGFKSLLLKPFAIFFEKKHAGAVIPIAVTGGPGHYRVTQDLSHEK